MYFFFCVFPITLFMFTIFLRQIYSKTLGNKLPLCMKCAICKWIYHTLPSSSNYISTHTHARMHARTHARTRTRTRTRTHTHTHIHSISQKWVHPSHFWKYFIISFHVTTYLQYERLRAIAPNLTQLLPIHSWDLVTLTSHMTPGREND